MNSEFHQHLAGRDVDSIYDSVKRHSALLKHQKYRDPFASWMRTSRLLLGKTQLEMAQAADIKLTEWSAFENYQEVPNELAKHIIIDTVARLLHEQAQLG